MKLDRKKGAIGFLVVVVLAFGTGIGAGRARSDAAADESYEAPGWVRWLGSSFGPLGAQLDPGSWSRAGRALELEGRRFVVKRLPTELVVPASQDELRRGTLELVAQPREGEDVPPQAVEVRFTPADEERPLEATDVPVLRVPGGEASVELSVTSEGGTLRLDALEGQGPYTFEVGG